MAALAGLFIICTSMAQSFAPADGQLSAPGMTGMRNTRMLGSFELVQIDDQCAASCVCSSSADWRSRQLHPTLHENA